LGDELVRFEGQRLKVKIMTVIMEEANILMVRHRRLLVTTAMKMDKLTGGTSRSSSRLLTNLVSTQPADFEVQRRPRSASSPSLIVRRTRLSTIGDRAFPSGPSLEQSATACHICNVNVCFRQLPEDTSLSALLPLIASAIVTVMPEK